VSLVTLFDEPTPLELLKLVRPDLYVKGGDYDIETLAETALVRSWGGDATALPSSRAIRRPPWSSASAAEAARSPPFAASRWRGSRVPRAGPVVLALAPGRERRSRARSTGAAARLGRALLGDVDEQRLVAQVRQRRLAEQPPALRIGDLQRGVARGEADDGADVGEADPALVVGVRDDVDHAPLERIVSALELAPVGRRIAW
jgi:hypothetical protein